MTLTRCGLAAIVAMSLAVPAIGQEEIKKINDKLDLLTKDLKDLKDSLKIDEVRAKAITIETKIDLLDREIQDIKKDVKELRRRAGEGPTTALRPEYDSARTQSNVRIINTHPSEMSVVLNGLSHRLAPGEERLFRIPAGPYSFEVLQIPARAQSGALASGETKTFTIYPIQ